MSGDALLPYDDALARVLAAVAGPLAAENVPLADAHGRALAADMVAREDLPPFDNSAVDGYALDGSRPPESGAWRIADAESAAGAPDAGSVPPGAAMRVFTGAPVPRGADRIVMQEDVESAGDGALRVLDLGTPGRFVRRRGSDVPAGTRAVPAGTTVDAAVIGLLAALNVADVPCARRPRVAVITTGDELISVGTESLRPGQIRDANGPALRAAVAEAGGVVAAIVHARDTAADVRRAFDACGAVGCDVIVASGGVSVGAHDHVRAVAAEGGGLEFWRIAIKPGKPLAFGRVGGALFFGLPGNPVSSLVTFELFVRPALRALGGHAEATRRRVAAVLDEALPHEPGRREFVRARLRWDEASHSFRASITGPQGSHRLHSLLGADAYLIADEARGDYAPGERLPALLLG